MRRADALRALLLGLCLIASPAVAQETNAGPPAIDPEAFGTWLVGVRTEALARGIRPGTIDRAFDGLAPVPTVLERDRNQPEFTLDLPTYLQRRVTSKTVQTARRLLHHHRTVLRRVSRAYGVDARIQIAVWGLESNFGRFSGVRPAIPTLATLAFDDRRSGLFRGELLDALTIVDGGHVALEHLKGSWAGALGQVQFLPSSYLAWAVDFDKNGRPDIWASLPDVFASIANYLRGHGWTDTGGWGWEVDVPDAATATVSAVPLRGSGCRAVRALTEPRPLQEWKALGIVRHGGRALPAGDRPASLLQKDGHAWLVTASYEAVLAYNCAHSYAMSVVTLADRLPRQ